jgi:hypothetical protein
MLLSKSMSGAFASICICVPFIASNSTTKSIYSRMLRRLLVISLPCVFLTPFRESIFPKAYLAAYRQKLENNPLLSRLSLIHFNPFT